MDKILNNRGFDLSEQKFIALEKKYSVLDDDDIPLEDLKTFLRDNPKLLQYEANKYSADK